MSSSNYIAPILRALADTSGRYAYFHHLPQKDLPYIKIPLHTLMNFTPQADLLGTDFGGSYVSRKARKYSLNFKSIFQWKSFEQLQNHSGKSREIVGKFKLLEVERNGRKWAKSNLSRDRLTRRLNHNNDKQRSITLTGLRRGPGGGGDQIIAT
ncbi:hypothetical protein B0H13DRAFT_1899119 [Mycena leptocephala]|nr:hypothetical protein B0H13DRAFT_1899119 [Mycena leptocephala]